MLTGGGRGYNDLKNCYNQLKRTGTKEEKLYYQNTDSLRLQKFGNTSIDYWIVHYFFSVAPYIGLFVLAATVDGSYFYKMYTLEHRVIS